MPKAETTENPAPKPVVRPTTKTPRAVEETTQRANMMSSLFVAFEDTEEHLNVMYWGREGSGKTIDLAAATENGRVLFINAEGGLKKQALASHKINTANLVVYPKPGDPITYRGLEEVVFQIKSDLMDDPKSWYLVAWDSVTEIAQALTDEVSEERFTKSKTKNPNWTPGLGDEFFTDISDYGVSTKMVRKLVRMFRDLPVHFAMTALERRDVDEDTSKVSYGPAVGPALQTSLLGYVDVVLYTKASDEDRPYFRAQTKKVGTARAKDRLGVIPKVLVNPTFPRLAAYNDGTLEETTDPVQAILTEAPVKTAAKTRRKPAAAKPEPATKEPAQVN